MRTLSSPVYPPASRTSHCVDRDLMLRNLLDGTQRASVSYAEGQHSPFILKIGSIRLLTGHQIEWILEELGFDIAEVATELKKDTNNTRFDMWAQMSWSQENGFESTVRAINNARKDAINVFELRGRQRLTTVGAKLSFLLRLVKAVQEDRPQPFPEQNCRTFGAANPASQEQEQLLQWDKLDSRLSNGSLLTDFVFRTTGHPARDADMLKLQEGASTYIKA
ncbi:hypothetical protein CF319_g8932 [Tilletia indica]|nr:hypothetical protein CF319_g8932 [Tilletia indica]